MVKLVTVVTHSDGYFPWLEKSCKRFNVELIKLGWGQKWLGFSWRFKLMIDYLKTIDPDELVIFIDAYDVILLRPLDDIEEYYNNIVKMSNKKIIIAKDKVINPFINLIATFYFDTCKDTRICAGTYLGKCLDILEILNKIDYEISVDDQILFTNYFKKNPNEVYIDTDYIFFLTHSINLKDILKDTYIQINNKELTYMNSKPFFIHANDNTYMHNLILKLDYKISDNEIDIINSKFEITTYKKKIYYINLLIKKYKKIFFLLILISCFIILYKYKIFACFN
jgi:hypothetical protein